MTQRTLLASASRFAHLIPGHRAAKSDDDMDAKDKAARKAEDDKPKKEDDDDDTKAKKKAEEGDGVTDENEGIDKEDKPDLDDVKDPDDSLDDDDDVTPPGEDDSDPKVRKAARTARKAADARWAKVLGHTAAAGRVAAACNMLATQPRASARSIIGTLASLPSEQAPAATGRTRLDDRMAERPNAKVGQDVPAAAGGDFGAQTRAAMAKVRTAR